MSDNPYNIKTDAGQRLWTYLNNQHGAGTWGLAGQLIPLIEEEVVQQERIRILTLLEEWVADDYGDFDRTLELIKKESQ